jgi:hypothetical protein
MRYIFAVIDSHTNSGSSDEMVAIDAFNDKIEAAGQRIIAAGLVTPSEAFVFDARGGSSAVTKGPINTTVEYMSGFWIIEASDDDIAHELATEASRSCNRKIEVRRFLR